MNRIEIEAKLNRARADLLESLAALTPEELSRAVTPSQHAGSEHWSAKDHLAHLAGIENLFNAMIRRHLTGDPSPVQLPKDAEGNVLPREQIMPGVHAMNEKWVTLHRDKSFTEIVALGQKVRADTLALLATLTDEQLLEKVPGAVWADGTIGGIMALQADHGQSHYKQVSGALAAGR